MPTFPFEATPDEIQQDPESYVDAVFSSLESDFLVMPKGQGFVEYPVFERGYEALKAATAEFADLDPDKILQVALSEPISIVVLMAMLGFTPPEWAYVTTERTGENVSQGWARSLDRKIRISPESKLSCKGVTKGRMEAMVKTACRLPLARRGGPGSSESTVASIEQSR